MLTLSGLITPIVLVFLILIVANASFRVLRQYERAVMFTLGRFSGTRGPGLIFLVPWIQQIVRVDLRTVVIEVPSQDLITRDNVSVKVDAVLYFHVVDPEKSIIQVEQYLAATNMLAQTTLRSVLGQHELDELLAKRATLNDDVQAILDERTKEWGILVTAVEIRDVQLTDNMVKAIAKQAEAERDRRAKVIHAEAEFQAAQTLTNAATILASVPAAMQLRYLQTLDGNRRRTQLDRGLPHAARYRQTVSRHSRSESCTADTERAQSSDAVSIAAGPPGRDDGLIRTTLRIGRGLPASSIAEVVRVLQRVPGVLTVDADAENAQAFVAHDAAVPTAALVAAANAAGAAAMAVSVPGASVALVKPGGAAQRLSRRPLLAIVGLAAMLAVILIDIVFPNSPDKRWLFIVPVILIWAFILLRATLVRSSSPRPRPRS